jgi:hypothetical protein
MTTAAATRGNESGGYNRYGQLRSFKSVRFGAIFAKKLLRYNDHEFSVSPRTRTVSLTQITPNPLRHSFFIDRENYAEKYGLPLVF